MPCLLSDANVKKARTTVIIPAGGSGQRMGGQIPKQFMPLGDRPVLSHTLACFEACSLVDSIVLVVPPDWIEHCRARVLSGLSKVKGLVEGGDQRWTSVRAGIEVTDSSAEIILVHDGVRPFVSQGLIARVIEGACRWGAVVPALPIKETVKQVEGDQILSTPDRSRLWSAQTPQGFRRELLLAALKAGPGPTPATDDAALVERQGAQVRIVEGEAENIKLTTPDDLGWAQWRLGRRERAMRIGQGYDVHQLGPDRRLILGGVEIPFPLGLVGHSDADVLTHAIIDALLGATGQGDIGRLFPDTDPQFKDISSLLLLEQVGKRIAQIGAQVFNIDGVIMAQRPKLAPHIPAMCQSLARVLQLPPQQISLKATTTEQLGFVGRQEGMAAQAVALVGL